LEARGPPSFISEAKRCYGGQITAGALTADRYSLAVYIERPCILRDPSSRVVCVVGCRREGSLWRKPVINVYNDGLDTVGESSTGRIADVEIARGPTASMEVNEDRQRRLRRRSVHPSRDPSVSARDQDALYGGDWLSYPGQPNDASYESALLLDPEFLDGTDALCVQPFEELSRFGMQHLSPLAWQRRRRQNNP
jgi:hypothetical protein